MKTITAALICTLFYSFVADAGGNCTDSSFPSQKLTVNDKSDITKPTNSYTKFGCYDQRPTKEDLLIFDRNNIQWQNIKAYMHDLARRCNDAARNANKHRNDKKYSGFALHYFGECYGRTQGDLDRFTLQEQSSRCIGDQTYTVCKDEHKECAGKSFAEYVYTLD